MKRTLAELSERYHTLLDRYARATLGDPLEGVSAFPTTEEPLEHFRREREPSPTPEEIRALEEELGVVLADLEAAVLGDPFEVVSPFDPRARQP